MKSHTRLDLLGSLLCSACFFFSALVWGSQSPWTGSLIAIFGVLFACQYVGMKRESHKATAIAERAFKAVDKQVKKAKA